MTATCTGQKGHECGPKGTPTVHADRCGVGRPVLRERSLQPRQDQPLTLPPLPGRPECESRLSLFSSCRASSASWATRSSEAEGPPELGSVQRRGSVRQQSPLHTTPAHHPCTSPLHFTSAPPGHLVSTEPSEPRHPELAPSRPSPVPCLHPAARHQIQDT